MQAKLFYGVLSVMVVGIGVQTVWAWPLATALWLLVLGFGLAVVWRQRSEAPLAPHLLLASACLIAFSCGLLRTEIASWQFGVSPLRVLVGEEVTLSGTVVAEPDYRERTVQLYIQTETDKVLVSTDRLTDVSYGDVVEVQGTLEQPDSFTTDLGRTFDYPGYLRARGIEYRMSFAEVTVAGSGEGNPIVARLLSAKKSFIAALQRVIPEPAVGLGNGLLLGVKSALGTDIEDDFRRTGIIHIVVLSGYNVMLVVAFILFCFSFFLSLRWRLVAGVFAIAAFALIVGLSATVLRASVMASLLLVAQFLGRRYHVMRALLFAGVVMLLINPYLLMYDIGFQLSFMATLGLVLLLPQFESTVVEKGRSLGWQEFLLSTIATQIAALPLLLYHIGEVSLIAVVVNVLVLPVVPIAMLLTFLTGIWVLAGFPLAGIVAYIATLLLVFILAVAGWFADLPFAAVIVPAFPAWGVLLSYVVLFSLWYWHQQRAGVGATYEEWVIEEEVEVAVTARRSLAVTATDLPSELPIFFR